LTGREHRPGIPKDLAEILLIAGLLLAFGFWEHFPTITPNHYTDIASIFWREGIGKGRHGIPYYDYVFEYPVIVGFFTYLSSYFGRAMSPDFSISMAYYSLAMDIVLIGFALGTVVVVYKLCELTGTDKKRMLPYFLVTLSFIMFTIYNWDIFAVFFSTLSIYFYLLGKKRHSAVSLGLGIASKIYPAVLGIVYLLEEKTWKERLIFFALAASVFALLNAPFMILRYDVWFGTWQHHMTWGIENSWLIYFFDQMDLNAHYASLAVLLYLVYKGIVGTIKKTYPSQASRIIERSFLMSLAWLIGSYVCPPQMALMLLPFLVLMPLAPLWLFYLAEISNALIIVLWFTPQLNLGNPLVASSPVQALSAIRQFIWFIFFLRVLYPGKLKTWTEDLFARIR
jgi:hypothetical protein